MTVDEIAILTQFRTDNNLLWAGPQLVSESLQTTGTSGQFVFLDRPVAVPIPEVKAMFPVSEAAALANYLNSADGAGINWMLEGLENPDINHPTFAQLLGYLATVPQVISMTTVISILDLGKRLKTISEDLFSRQLTLEEITEGIHAWEVANAQ